MPSFSFATNNRYRGFGVGGMGTDSSQQQLQTDATTRSLGLQTSSQLNRCHHLVHYEPMVPNNSKQMPPLAWATKLYGSQQSPHINQINNSKLVQQSNRCTVPYFHKSYLPHPPSPSQIMSIALLYTTISLWCNPVGIRSAVHWCIWWGEQQVWQQSFHSSQLPTTTSMRFDRREPPATNTRKYYGCYNNSRVGTQQSTTIMAHC